MDNLTPKNEEMTELEKRLLEIKKSNRELVDRLVAADKLRNHLDDPTVVTLEGPSPDEQEICLRMSKTEYFHLCELLGLPTDSTPQERLDLEIDSMLDEPDDES